LVQAAVERGAVFLPETTAHIGPVTPGARWMNLMTQDAACTVSAKVVIAASGLGAKIVDPRELPPASLAENAHVGAGAIFPFSGVGFDHGVIYMACGRAGYVGVVRVENDLLDVAAAMSPQWIREQGGLSEAAAALLAEAGLPVPQELRDASWKGTPPLTRTMKRPAAERLFVVGDAAGYIEPFTGEGMAWAMASGVAVAPIAARAARFWNSAYIDQWCGRHSAVVRRRQWTCRALAAALRRPGLVAVAMPVLNRVPWLAKPVVRHLNSVRSLRKAVAP
jgi:menaquinone-9 beta-reductase